MGGEILTANLNLCGFQKKEVILGTVADIASTEDYQSDDDEEPYLDDFYESYYSDESESDSQLCIFPEHLTLPKKSDYLFVMRFLGSKEKHLSICCPHLEKDTSSVDIFILDGLCTSGRDSSCTPTTYFNASTPTA